MDSIFQFNRWYQYLHIWISGRLLSWRLKLRRLDSFCSQLTQRNTSNKRNASSGGDFYFAALCLMASIFGLSLLPNYFPSLLEQSLAIFGQTNYFPIKMMLLAICMNLLVLTPCTICGTIFPLVLSLSKRTAKLLAYNTVGCVSGYISLWALFEGYSSKTGNTTTEMCFLVILGTLYVCSLVLIFQISKARITIISGVCLTLIVLSAPLIMLRTQWSKEAMTHSAPNSLRFLRKDKIRW